MENKPIEPMEFFKLDKLSDDVYSIGLNTILRFNVSLSKTANGKRYIFHKEFEYPSKSDDISTLVTIRRSFDYYLSIENVSRDSSGNKLFIRIGPQEYYSFKQGLETAMTWFTDPKYANLFATSKGELIITPPIPNHIIKGLPQNKSIELIPCIISYGIGLNEKTAGVRFYFDQEHKSCTDIPVDRLFGLYYIIDKFNMYQAAADMINYISRPEFGTNRVVLSGSDLSNRSQNLIEEKPKTASGITGRFVQPRDKNGNIINTNIKSLEE